MKERVGDEKLIIISVAVRGVNDHIRWVFYFQTADSLDSKHTRACDFVCEWIVLVLEQWTPFAVFCHHSLSFAVFCVSFFFIWLPSFFFVFRRFPPWTLPLRTFHLQFGRRGHFPSRLRVALPFSFIDDYKDDCNENTHIGHCWWRIFFYSHELNPWLSNRLV